MGNSGSSHSHPQNQEMTRGWAHSFPRELGRHHQHTQPAGHKVLPEPPNQRLRATNNGNIIHNGGTISGRRPSTLTLPHDLNKNSGIFRSRSTSATNFARAKNSSVQESLSCCQYQQGEYRSCFDNEMRELKRFGSEPDLRCAPVERQERGRQERAPHPGYYGEREARERESRYRGKKKYKAPAPPVNGTNDGSSPDSYKWENQNPENPRFRSTEETLQPPPRRSRLFKTRAETKRAQVNWMVSSSPSQQDHREIDNDRRWRQERLRPSKAWREQERPKEDNRRGKVIHDGKNTLQRSMSSPEFQAELMQVARKVRNKLNYEKAAPVGEPTALSYSKNEAKVAKDDRRVEPERRIPRSKEEQGRCLDRRISRSQENFELERANVREIRKEIRLEEKRYEKRLEVKAASVKTKELVENKESHIRIPEKRKPLNERVEILEQKQHHDVIRTRSESPIGRRTPKLGIRGQGSGRESTPEPPESALQRHKDKENSDPQRRSQRMSESSLLKKDFESAQKMNRKQECVGEDNWHIIPPQDKAIPKTFYFGMDESLRESLDPIQMRLNNSVNDFEEGKGQNGVEDIALKLRPTLPKKQLEIPRFSPSAAWRLLSALETPGPTMSTASEEVPVMFEERIERLSRPPPPLLALGPRSSHDKSGDSGISGDAGAPNDDSLDVSTSNRLKSTGPARPAWTPQQDLGEESSSDAGVDSPPPPPMPMKFQPRTHVFSLSLPRDDTRMYLYNPDAKSKEGSSFNSLQKLKRSVSGAFGLSTMDVERKRNVTATSTSDALDDNWLLSSSAPNSLQHNVCHETVPAGSAWDRTFEDDGGDEDDDDDDEEEDEEESEDKTDFPLIMKPPSFSYLASGGHIMYLPTDSSGSGYKQPQSLSVAYRNGREMTPENLKFNNSNEEHFRNGKFPSTYNSSSLKGSEKRTDPGDLRNRSSFTGDSSLKNRRFSNFSKSCENISEMRQRASSPTGPENLQDGGKDQEMKSAKQQQNSKGKRFTFQSTVRQIERRRLAEKLSREAEARERQRKGELEAMRKVEEEFQRKRAREKANIRQQLRLYNMDDNLSSLPAVWDNSQLSRADPDGAPSSSASSPTSAPPGKLPGHRKCSVSSDEYHRKSTESKQQQQREYKDYRPRYHESSTYNIEHKQTTVHPKVIYDIPKSSPVFVDANIHGSGKERNVNSATPRSDNYRKDFAHGAVAAKSSLASSDSELSQPNTRPHSRQNVSKGKPVRSRSASPARSEEARSSEEESPVEAVKQERSHQVNGFILNGGVQPFVREKSYRPISFNPQPPPPPIPS